ncbi:MAG: helix-turn-helix domain-containing protein [Pyrinomonadaceae bacterium]
MEKDKSQTFDRREAAQRLGLSVATIDRELAREKITHFRSGRRVLFTQAHLDDYIKRNECKAN